MKKIEPGDKCENELCGGSGHDATEIWVGDGGSLAATRDYMQKKWCLCCVVKAQLDHARKMAPRIAELERELAKACIT